MNKHEIRNRLVLLWDRLKPEQTNPDLAELYDTLAKPDMTLEELLDVIGVSIRDLQFDLDATRRENGYLRKMLEEAENPPDNTP